MSALTATVFLLLASYVAAELELPVPISEEPEAFDYSALNVAEMLKQGTQTTCLSEHNQQRANNGKGTLRANKLLEKAAADHNQYMTDKNCFSHQCDGEKSLGDRVTATGYKWRALGENIAKGQQDCASVMNSWMNSKGHRANILSDNQEVGCSRFNNGPLWTCVFGTQ